MKHYLLTFALILVIINAFSQKLLPFQNPQSKKWGYKSDKGIVIEPIYEAAKPYYKGYACVKTAKGWGIIFQSEKEYVIEPQFVAIKILDDHNLWVQNPNKLWGIMNYDGTYVQSCQYQSLDFWDKPEGQLYDTPLPNWDTLIFKQNNTFGLMTRNGTILSWLPYNYIGNFEGTYFAVVCLLNEEGVGQKWGVIDKSGKEIVACIYDDLGVRWGDWYIQLKNRRIMGDKIWARLGESCGYFNFKGEIIELFSPCK